MAVLFAPLGDSMSRKKKNDAEQEERLDLPLNLPQRKEEDRAARVLHRAFVRLLVTLELVPDEDREDDHETSP